MAKNRSLPEITLEILHIGAGGDGVGNYNGKKVYVPKTAPGDTVRARIERTRTDGIDARLVEIITPSPDRVTPLSPYHDQCGGCALQHVNEKFYRSWKTGKVKTTLQRAGAEPLHWNDPVFLPAATRRRTTLAAVKLGSILKLGYHAPRSHTVTDVKECEILTPPLDDMAQKMRPYLLRLLPDGKEISILIQYVEGHYDVVFTGALQGKKGFTLEQHESLAEMAQQLSLARISLREKESSSIEPVLTLSAVRKKFGALHVDLPPGAFLQASAEGEETLTDFVTKNYGGTENVADLFAGCGTFAGALMQQGASVSAFETDAGAINAMSAAGRDYKNFRAFKRDLFREPVTAAELSAFTCVVFDPPRAGAAAQCAELAMSDVPRLVAISCDPGTFARDAKILIEGGYIFQSATLIDQFVWSSHAELAALFIRA